MKTITIKDITISLSDDDLVELKKQLEEKPKFPKWEDIGTISWHYVNSDDWKVEKGNGIYSFEENTNWIRPTRELCEASIALAKLVYLRNLCNDWLEQDLDINTHKHGIVNCYGKISVGYFVGHNMILYFKDKETRDWFLEAYKNLITIALPLI